MLSSSGIPKGVVQRGIGVDLGVVRGVATGDEIKLSVVGLITPLNALTGLIFGYENNWCPCGCMCAKPCSGLCRTEKGLDIIDLLAGGVPGELLTT